MCVAAVTKADPLEQLVRAWSRSSSTPASPSWIPTSSRAVSSPRAPASNAGRRSRSSANGSGPQPNHRGRHVGARDSDRAGRGPVEAGNDPEQGRLTGAARPEHDAELTLLDGQSQTLQRRDAALR